MLVSCFLCESVLTVLLSGCRQIILSLLFRWTPYTDLWYIIIGCFYENKTELFKLDADIVGGFVILRIQSIN